MPVSVTVCGVFDASSVIERLADFVPVVCGENRTKTVHERPGAISLPKQLSLAMKSPAFAPVEAICEKINAALPVFFMEIDCGALEVPMTCGPKVKLAGVICASARKTPLPVSGTLCGLPTALLAISMLAENAPADCGENVAEILQDKLGARLIGQLFVSRKSAAFGPVSPIACAKLRDAFPVLVIVNVSAELCVPTFCDPKSQLSGVT